MRNFITTAWASPLKYVVLYVMLIFVFPIFYCNMSGEFYAPYAKLEPAAKRDIESIVAAVKKSVLLKLKYVGDKTLSDYYYIDGNDINIFNQRMNDDGALELTIRLALRHRDAQGWAGFPNLKIVLDAQPGIILRDKPDLSVASEATGEQLDTFYCRHVALVDTSKDQFNGMGGLPEALPGEIFELLFSRMKFDVVALTKSEFMSFEDVLKGNRGDPTAYSNRYSRMLYFSAITMMTVGFGDIVPIGDNARGLAAFQAIVGLIVMGLFLNALAVRIKEK